jgi:5'-3' exonuclease
MNEEMRVQIEDVKEIVSILGGVNINIEGVEADDIGGTLNKIFNKKNVSVELYSSDKD